MVVLSLVKHLKRTSSAVVLVVGARARQNVTKRHRKFAPTPTRHPANWEAQKEFVVLASRVSNLTESTDALKWWSRTSASTYAFYLMCVNDLI